MADEERRRLLRRPRASRPEGPGRRCGRRAIARRHGMGRRAGPADRAGAERPGGLSLRRALPVMAGAEQQYLRRLGPAPGRARARARPARDRARLLRREAVEQAVAARAAHRVRAAAARRVRRVPGARRLGVAEPDAVVVADHGRAFAALRPVAAGHVLLAGNGAAVGRGAGEDIVPVRAVAAAVDRLALLVEPGLLVDLAVGMQVVHAGRDLLALRVLPRALADAVAGVDLFVAEIGRPLALPGARRLGQVLAVPVGALQAAEVGALARPGAGNEEGHVLLLRMDEGREKRERQDSNQGFHGNLR